MKTVAIDVTESADSSSLKSFFQKNKLEKGDQLIVQVDNESHIHSWMVAGVLFLLAITWIDYYSDRKNQEKGKSLKTKLEDKSASIEAIQHFFKAEAGFKVDVEVKPQSAYDPLIDGLGLWDDNEITLDEIRTKAWVKTV